MSVLLAPLRALTVTLLLALVGVPALQIVLRLVGAPLIGAEEFTRFLLICLVFLGYPLVVAAGDNIVMAELRLALPKRFQVAIGRLIALGGTAAAGVIHREPAVVGLEGSHQIDDPVGHERLADLQLGDDHRPVLRGRFGERPEVGAGVVGDRVGSRFRPRRLTPGGAVCGAVCGVGHVGLRS
jgi:hypothetical protein